MYRIVRELGRGGMGVVYEGLHEHLQRRVAIKVMRPELAADATQVERFVREGRAAANIRHPHVIDVYEFAFVDGAPYLVMPFLEGQTLAERLVVSRRLPLPALLGTLFPVFSAVAAAHAAGVVHRDLKPSNIMLAYQPDGHEVPKVLDFGTSKLLTQAELVLTQSAATVGTPAYMAPEQVRSSRDVDARCDQYALGVLLYECATGRMPFDAESQYELLHAIMSAPLAAPSTFEPSLPAAFDAVVMRAMQRDPAQRFPSVRALGAALLDLAPAELARSWSAEFATPERSAPAAVSVKPASATLPDASQVRTRSRKLQWYVLAAALLAAAGALWAIGGGGSRPQSAAEHPEQPLAAKVEAPPAAQPPSEPQPPAAGPASAPTTSNDAPAAKPAAQAAEVPPAKPAAARRTRPREHGPRPTTTSPRPSVTVGDNGAPILE
ncbi:MAG TPA: serine/threonine-protein kinase [Polyangiales bacterium]|nr:serine/threonine-protein kinase [Polyangiales bacterium]